MFSLDPDHFLRLSKPLKLACSGCLHIPLDVGNEARMVLIDVTDKEKLDKLSLNGLNLNEVVLLDKRSHIKAHFFINFSNCALNIRLAFICFPLWEVQHVNFSLCRQSLSLVDNYSLRMV